MVTLSGYASFKFIYLFVYFLSYIIEDLEDSLALSPTGKNVSQ